MTTVQSTDNRANIRNSFVDYLAGRKIGYYLPTAPPTYQKKNNETNKRTMADYVDMMTEELFDEPSDKEWEIP